MSRVIGLTGGIASGKSTVAQLLGEKGAWIVDADHLARAVVEINSPALAEIAETFGAGVIGSDGSLDRPKLGQLVFSDETARDRLNAIVHPRVLELSREEIRKAEESGAQLTVYDVPLLFETAREKEFDGTLVVWVDPLTQLLRLRQRSGLDEIQARRRIDSQMPLTRKRELATWMIDNSRSPDATRAAVDALWANEFAPSR
ncbi:MAG TPA: dephospho-CoA kinase [Candidatus Dormibacteraeota bacterium]|nr:dephospho-CoA kinase [Candidatus Dormibacteraeota bacterium]